MKTQNTKYKILNDYRKQKGLSILAFARLIKVSSMVCYNTLTGVSKPYDYNEISFDKFIADNRDEIEKLTGHKIPEEE